MKKCIFFNFVLIVIANLTYSQGYISQKFRLGIIAEPAISWMSSDNRDVEYNNSRFGLNAGLAVDYYFQENYALSTGLTINSSGGDMIFRKSMTFHHSEIIDTLPENVSITYKLQYIELPLLLKLSTNQIGSTKYFVRIGFCPQLNIKAIADASAFNIRDEKINKEINLFNLSYYISGGFEYELAGNTTMLISLFYKNGFVDITENFVDGIIDKSSLKNLGLSIAILF